MSGFGFDAFDVDDAAARSVEPEPGEPDEHDVASVASGRRRQQDFGQFRLAHDDDDARPGNGRRELDFATSAPIRRFARLQIPVSDD